MLRCFQIFLLVLCWEWKFVSCHSHHQETAMLIIPKLPSILDFNLRNETARKEISSLHGRETTLAMTPNFDCLMKISSQVSGSTFTLSFSFKISCYGIKSSTTGRPYETCLFSSILQNQPRVLKLELLNGMASDNSCPSARQLVQVHHDTARQIGAKRSYLDDHSRFRLFRDDVSSMWIRTTLARLFFSPSFNTLSSYYSDLGYEFSFNGERDRQAVQEAFDFVRDFRTDSLLSKLDVSWQPNTEAIHIINQHPQYTSLTLLLRFLSHKHHKACSVITRLVSKIDLRAFHSNVSSLVEAVGLISKSRPMTADIH